MRKEYKVGIVTIFLFALTFFYKSISLNPKIYAIMACIGLIYIVLEVIRERKIAILLMVLIIIFLIFVLFFNMPMRWS